MVVKDEITGDIGEQQLMKCIICNDLGIKGYPCYGTIVRICQKCYSNHNWYVNRNEAEVAIIIVKKET